MRLTESIYRNINESEEPKTRKFVVSYWRGNPQLSNGGYYTSREYEVVNKSELNKLIKNAEDAAYGSMQKQEVVELKNGESYDFNKETGEITIKDNLDEAIEQKYEKSNNDYNELLRDVKKYTGSYNYLFGGKVETEYNGDPIKINYFYYERPYDKTSYNLVVNVLTPLGVNGDYIQEVIDNEFTELKYNKLTNKEIKDKINQIVSSID